MEREESRMMLGWRKHHVVTELKAATEVHGRLIHRISGFWGHRILVLACETMVCMGISAATAFACPSFLSNRGPRAELENRRLVL